MTDSYYHYVIKKLISIYHHQKKISNLNFLNYQIVKEFGKNYFSPIKSIDKKYCKIIGSSI